jgi:hypothetical protein
MVVATELAFGGEAFASKPSSSKATPSSGQNL